MRKFDYAEFNKDWRPLDRKRWFGRSVKRHNGVERMAEFVGHDYDWSQHSQETLFDQLGIALDFLESIDTALFDIERVVDLLRDQGQDMSREEYIRHTADLLRFIRHIMPRERRRW